MDSLGDRMKRYEAVPKSFLMRRTPAIIRIDGKAFHTFTKGFQKPFDAVLMQSMQQTMKKLCEEIQGCVLGYTQSDEVTLVLTDYDTIETDAWFSYNVEKMCSISSSIATLSFNKVFSQNVYEYDFVTKNKNNCILDSYLFSINKGALFDARVFSLPKEEVCNCLIWRQQDAVRNSIQSVGQSKFSHKTLQNLSCDEIQERLWKEKQINWNDFPIPCKRGSCCIKKEVNGKSKWIIDLNIPIFTQNRNYIEELI